MGDATLALAVLTACLFAAGYSYHDAFFSHWVLPAGAPAWETDVVLREGFEGGGAFGVIFLIWLAAAHEHVPSIKKREAAWHHTVRVLAALIPAVIFIFVVARLAPVLRLLARWDTSLVFVLFALAILGLAAAAVWFVRTLGKERIMGHSRATDAAVVALVAVSTLIAASAYGELLGHSAGARDADGEKSTLRRVSFEFAGDVNNKTDWRLLAHAEGMFYVFDFSPELKERGHPTVFMIPDSAVLQARLAAP